MVSLPSVLEDLGSNSSIAITSHADTPYNQATGWKRQSEVFEVSLCYNNNSSNSNKACVDVGTCWEKALWCDGIARSYRRGTAVKRSLIKGKREHMQRTPEPKH